MVEIVGGAVAFPVTLEHIPWLACSGLSCLLSRDVEAIKLGSIHSAIGAPGTPATKSMYELQTAAIYISNSRLSPLLPLTVYYSNAKEEENDLASLEAVRPKNSAGKAKCPNAA